MKNKDKGLSRRNWLGWITSASLGSGLVTLSRGPIVTIPAEVLSQTDRTDTSVYDIRDFGAVGDGKTLCTQAVQAAIDICNKNRGGIVMVPAGTYVIGTVELKSNVTLYLSAQATLLGTKDGKQYHAANEIPLQGDATLVDGNVGLLYAVKAENISIEGSGVIDGQGAQFRSPVKGAPSPAGISGPQRPYHILLYRCTNITIKEVRLKNSAFHSIRIIQSEYVKIQALHIHSRVIHNNDGFHFISCKYVHVHACDVQTQDDACALFGSCQYITISDCTFSTRWSVFRFGGGFVQNVTINNCTIFETYGCPIKLHCSLGSRFEDILFSNLVFKDVTGPIYLGISERRSSSITENALPPGVLRRISFNNIRATVVEPRPLPDAAFQSTYRPGEQRTCIVLNAFGTNYMENISFNDVHITYPGGGTASEAMGEVPESSGEYFEIGTPPSYALFARNIKGLTLHNVRVCVNTPDLRPAIMMDKVEDALVTGLSIEGNKESAALRARNCVDILISAARVLKEGKAFINVEGKYSDNIKIDGGDFSKCQKDIVLGSEVASKAVIS